MTKTANQFLIGFEVGSGEAVQAQLHHLFISGVTQHSGKTTSLEAFLSRAGQRALIFRCGRGEIGFDGAKHIRPYFRERTDWRFVEGLLSAHLQEKSKFYRSNIMRACRNAKGLGDIYNWIKDKLANAREGSWDEKVYTELDQYFSEIIPTLGQIDFASSLELSEGLNMIDLEGVPVAVQQLIISSCADWIMEKMHGVILVVPEAWQMIPQDRGSPVKLAAENLIRQGAKLGNYLWLDSQQMTGVSMDILRNIDLWMFGRQTLDLEKERVAKMIPGKSVKPDDVHALRVGQFYVVQYGETVQKVYVLPGWAMMPEGRAVAMGEMKLDKIMETKPNPKTRVNPMDREKEAELKRLRVENASLKDVVQRLEADVQALKQAKPVTPAQVEKVVKDAHRPSQKPRPQVPEEESAPSSPAPARQRFDLDVKVSVPNLTIREEVVNITRDDKDNQGRVAILIAEDFFDSSKTINAVCTEFRQRGWGAFSGGGGAKSMASILAPMCTMGFLRNDGSASPQFTVVQEAKERVKRVKA